MRGGRENLDRVCLEGERGTRRAVRGARHEALAGSQAACRQAEVGDRQPADQGGRHDEGARASPRRVAAHAKMRCRRWRDSPENQGHPEAATSG